MRKITELAVKAFYNFEDFKSSNTEVDTFANVVTFYLFWHAIARIEPKGNESVLYVSSAGWQTVTTKERLNGILAIKGLYIKQKDFVWYLCDNHGNEIEFKKGNSLDGVIIF